jgi:hypothetical protein
MENSLPSSTSPRGEVRAAPFDSFPHNLCSSLCLLVSHLVADGLELNQENQGVGEGLKEAKSMRAGSELLYV